MFLYIKFLYHPEFCTGDIVSHYTDEILTLR